MPIPRVMQNCIGLRTEIVFYLEDLSLDDMFKQMVSEIEGA